VIADYHFTTLSPVLGVVNLHESSFVIADIPGLIKGASTGTGLGHDFLKHVERCRLFVHVIDVSGYEGRNPCEDFEIILQELNKFDKKLNLKPMLVAGNKSDLISEDEIKKVKNYIESKNYEFFEISVATKRGINGLLNRIEGLLQKLPEIKYYEPEVNLDEIINNYDNKFIINKQDNIYFIESDWLNKIVNSTDFDDSESLGYFQKILNDYGISEELKKLKINQGDIVNIHGFEFNFFD